MSNMWDRLASPSLNLQTYSQNNQLKLQNPDNSIDLRASKSKLFCNKNVSQNNDRNATKSKNKNTREGSSLKISSQMKSNRKQNNSSQFNLSSLTKGKYEVTPIALKSQKKSSILLSNKLSQESNENLKIKTSEKCFLPSSLKKSTHNKNWLIGKNNCNNEEQSLNSFSLIYMNQINKTQCNKKSTKNHQDKYFYQMFVTLKEIREIQKQKLSCSKEILKFIKEKTNAKDHKENKDDLHKLSKSRNNKGKEKSTLRKPSRNSMLENKVNEKLKEVEKMKLDLENIRKSCSKTKKKSQSAFR